jgi:hypothetical protein
MSCQIHRLGNENGIPVNVMKTGVVWIWCRKRRMPNLDLPNQLSDALDRFVLQVHNLSNQRIMDPVRIA